jgi:tetratricopeptide (TPR) repeat protein
MVKLTRVGFGIIFASAVGGLSLAYAQGQERHQLHMGLPPGYAEHFGKLRFPIDNLEERAASEEAGGDLAGAEHLLLERNRLDPHTEDYHLEMLQEKMGKYKEALPEYRWRVDSPNNRGGESNILARCADLDMIYGSKEDARKEYMMAANAPTRGGEDKMFAPVAAGEPVDETASLTQLRAAAYYNAGSFYVADAGRKDLAQKYFELALSLEPNDALMRFGYASVSPDPRAEMWLAEKEATGALKEALHRWRVRIGGTYGSSSTAIINGNAVTTETPYIPKGVTETNPNGNIFTPHVVDPVLQGRAGWIWEGCLGEIRL